MTKYLFTTQEIPHQFAADSRAYCSNSGRTLRAESGVLWSYSEPIAMYHGDSILVSADSFSVTTSRHQRKTSYALNHLKTLHVPSLKALQGCVTEIAFADWISKRVVTMDKIRISMVKMRAEWKKTQALRQIADLESACAYVWAEMAKQKTPWQYSGKVKAKADKIAAIRRYTLAHNQLESGLEYAKRILREARNNGLNDAAMGRNYGRQAFWRLYNVQKDICRIDTMGAYHGIGKFGSTATFEYAAKLMGKKWSKDCTALAVVILDFADTLQPEIATLRADYDRAESIADSDRLAAWRAGGNVLPRGGIALRVVDNEVQTSKGARIPLADGLMIADLAKACHDSGKSLDLRGRKFGSYHGNSIATTGNVTISCHVISYDAIVDCVKRYQESK